MRASGSYPQRIVCLTDETTETSYLLGEAHRIVGISGFTVRPPRARTEKPKVSGFTNARIDRILTLSPDLVLGYSDLQADIARSLIQGGVEVHVFNQRDIAGILRMIRTLGAMVGAQEKAERLAAELESHVAGVQAGSANLVRRPRVYFEEWDQPMISGIGWVSELIAVAGGVDCFAELAREPLAKNRVIADPAEVVRRRPDVIIGSWCGKRFEPQRICARTGWEEIPAVRRNGVFEIESSMILQPGPAALTDGLKALAKLIHEWAVATGNGNDRPPLEPSKPRR